MSATGAAVCGDIAVASAAETVQELGRREREAIAEGNWSALDEILEAQKALWQELLGVAHLDDGSDECLLAAQALAALHDVRRRNHILIERSFAEMRRQLTTAHAGSDAKGAYQRTGRAA